MSNKLHTVTTVLAGIATFVAILSLVLILRIFHPGQEEYRQQEVKQRPYLCISYDEQIDAWGTHALTPRQWAFYNSNC